MAFDIADPPVFDVTIPLTRRTADGLREALDVRVRIPSVDADTAERAAVQIGYVIVDNLPNEDAGNRYGWKLAERGPTVEVTK